MDIIAGVTQCWLLGPTCRIDWAAWAAVFAALVGLLAWVTSKRAVYIAQQQHRVAIESRDAQARILGRLLLSEITALPARIDYVLRAWNAAISWDNPPTIVNSTALEKALEEASQSVLPFAENLDARIHNLPDALGDDLATMIGGSRTLNDLALRIGSRVRDPAWQPGGRSSVPLYAGSTTEFENLRSHLEWFLTLSPTFANEFRDFVGVSQEKYDFLAKLPPAA